MISFISLVLTVFLFVHAAETEKLLAGMKKPTFNFLGLHVIDDCFILFQ